MNKTIKAVGLISGGLDSTLAAAILLKMGVAVHGVHFALPWGCGSVIQTQKMAKQLGIPLHVIPADQTYLSVLTHPRHGYGSAINPCVDCHIHMIQKAAEYMRQINAEFVFTGEVLGQRPMSQLRHSLRAVEKSCGIEGRLLRPLCAKLLTPTIAETTGLIDREKLFAITGRGRKEQRRLAPEYGIHEFPNAAGGCLLTDKNFARRLRDLFDHGCKTLDETVILKWGRHLRISKDYKAIVGRDERECAEIAGHANPEDFLFEVTDKRGPAVILQGKNPDEPILAMAAGLAQYFSSSRGATPKTATYFQIKDPNTVRTITASVLSEKDVAGMKL